MAIKAPTAPTPPTPPVSPKGQDSGDVGHNNDSNTGAEALARILGFILIFPRPRTRPIKIRTKINNKIPILLETVRCKRK